MKRKPKESRIQFLHRLRGPTVIGDLRRERVLSNSGAQLVREERRLGIARAEKLAAALGCAWGDVVEP
jgi:hypothetical protein